MALTSPSARELLERVADRYFDEELAELALEIAPRLDPYLGSLPERSRATEIIGLGALLDNSYSMNAYEDVDEKEVEREPLRLYEALVRDVNFMWSELKKSSYRRSIHVCNDLLHPNIRYASRVLREGDTFHWMPLLPSVPTLVTKDFLHGNGTPLYKRSFEFILAGIARAELLRLPPFNRKTRMHYLIMSDGESTEDSGYSYPGHQFTAADVKMLVNQLPEGHTAYFLGLGQESYFGAVGRSMGIQKQNVRCVPREGKKIRAFLQLWSSSATDPTRLSDRDMGEFAIPVDSGSAAVAGGSAPELDAIFKQFEISPSADSTEPEDAHEDVSADETSSSDTRNVAESTPFESPAGSVDPTQADASSGEADPETPPPTPEEEQSSDESDDEDPPEFFDLFEEEDPPSNPN